MPVQSTTKVTALLHALRKDEVHLLDYLKQVNYISSPSNLA